MTASFGVVGNCETTPELRDSATGKSFCTFLLAVKYWIKDAVEQPAPEIYKVTAFGNLAVSVASTVRKGQRVVVAGTFEIEKWTGTDGTERSSSKILANAIGLDLRFTASKPAQEVREISKPTKTIV